jgi:hypothetical protein
MMGRSIALPVAKDYASQIVSTTARLVQYASEPAATFSGSQLSVPEVPVKVDWREGVSIAQNSVGCAAICSTPVLPLLGSQRTIHALSYLHHAAGPRRAELDTSRLRFLAHIFHVMSNASQRWRQCAEQARVMTDHMRGPRAKVAMMILAMNYEMLAVRAEQRELAEKLARYKDY